MKKGYILSIYRNSPEADKLAAYAPAAQAALQGQGAYHCPWHAGKNL